MGRLLQHLKVVQKGEGEGIEEGFESMGAEQ